MSHSGDAEEKEDLDCITFHAEELLKTLNGIGVISKSKVIAELEQIKKRVDYMLADLKGEL